MMEAKPRWPSSRTGITRRTALVAGVAALATSAASPASASAPSVSLGALAEKAGVLFGSAASLEALTEPASLRLHVDQCRIVTTDPGFILPFVRPEAGRTTFETVDRLIAVASGHRLKVRGHCLIWNDNVPAWVGRLSTSELERLLDRHVEETVGRFRGRIHSWDVVNEPFHPFQRQAGLWRRGPWAERLGPDHIPRALRRAAAADPSARMIVNEAWIERSDEAGQAVRRRLIELIDDLQSKGAPLHAVGLQCHLEALRSFDGPSFSAYLAEIARRKLDIYITELDVNDLEHDGDMAVRDATVAFRYRQIVEAALAEPSVKVIQTWGLADRFSWLCNPFFVRQFPPRRRRFAARPLPFDAELRPKPAHEALLAAFQARAL